MIMNHFKILEMMRSENIGTKPNKSNKILMFSVISHLITHKKSKQKKSTIEKGSSLLTLINIITMIKENSMMYNVKTLGNTNQTIHLLKMVL
jgi:hypothetical protein